MYRLSELLSVYEDIWQVLQHRVRDLPDAVITISSGKTGRGNFHASAYTPAAWHGFYSISDPHVCEVNIASELERPSDALTAILHAATHALADVRGIRDTSDRDRWHNGRFASLASEEFGLTFNDLEPRIGASNGILLADRIERFGYDEMLENISHALYYNYVGNAVVKG